VKVNRKKGGDESSEKIMALTVVELLCWVVCVDVLVVESEVLHGSKR